MYSDRSWIVQRKVLDAGKTKLLPDKIPTDFRCIRNNDPNVVFRMFQNGRFKDLFIFGLDLEQTADDVHRIALMVKDMNRSIYNVYYCTDDEVPNEWRSILEQFRIVSTAEGLSLLEQSNASH